MLNFTKLILFITSAIVVMYVLYNIDYNLLLTNNTNNTWSLEVENKINSLTWKSLSINNETNIIIGGINDSKTESNHISLKEIILTASWYTNIMMWPELKGVDNIEVNKNLSYENIIWEKLDYTLSNFKECECWIVNISYIINYDKDDLLDISFMIETSWAYLDFYNKYITIDLDKWKLVKLDDLLDSSKYDDLIKILNIKLEENIQETIDKNLEWITEALIEREFVFTNDNLYSFTLWEEWITFYYNFWFPHVIKAIEPKSSLFLNYEELKDFISKEWYLSN